jgi:hypothetical protein
MSTKLQIILNKSTGEKKHKQIEAISKKTAKIEKLELDLKKLEEKIKLIKEKVDSKTKEAKAFFAKIKEKYILLLIEKHQVKGITKWQQIMIEDIIQEEYRILSDLDLVSENLKTVIMERSKRFMENLSPFEKQMRDEAIKQMFKEMGIKPDKNMNFDDITNPDFMKDLEEKMHAEHQKKEQKQKEKEKQKQVKNTDIDFQKLYKKLVKLTHPDLSKSETEKEEKEHLMKQLTNSWEERNYYEIIMLWIQIDPENICELEITEANQKNIIKQLNAKISDLEYKDYCIKSKFHDSSFYYVNFNAPSEKGIDTKINKYNNELLLTTQKTEVLIKDYEITSNLKKELTKIKKEIEKQDNEYNQMMMRAFGSVFDEY